MNSGNPKQATWKTSDGSAWWLRSTRYNEPNGNYHANCYLHLWRTPHNSENNIQMDDGNCHYHSRSYYCQPIKKKAPPPPKPPPVPQPKTAKVGNFHYATLDNVPPAAKYGSVKGDKQTTKSCQTVALAVPKGWEIAPYDRSVLNHPWGTHCLIFADGKSYGGKAYGAGNNCGNNMLSSVDGRKYKARGCSRRIIIRKALRADNEVVIGDGLYATLDGVKPNSKYGTDKGLSMSSCHQKQYARAVPEGWELAPYDRKVLDFPWSTHCLIFKDGKSYGGKAYGSGNNCGGGMLVKTGDKYYSRGCSRRIIIRKKGGAPEEKSLYACEANKNYVGEKKMFGKKTGVASKEECGKLCDAQKGCTVYVYNKYKDCYLKSDVKKVKKDNKKHKTVSCKKQA